MEVECTGRQEVTGKDRHAGRRNATSSEGRSDHPTANDMSVTDASRPLWGNSFARRGTLSLWDSACWSLATAVVLGVRLDFMVTDIQWGSTLRYLAITVVLLIAFGYVTKFYRGRFRIGSFDEVTGLAGQFAIVGVTTALFFTIPNPALPAASPSWCPRLPWSAPPLVDGSSVPTANGGRPGTSSRSSARSCTAPATRGTSS